MLDNNHQTAAHRTHHFSTIGSTNVKVREMLDEGAEPPFWIVADEQTGGRGRLGRNWEGGKGNLFTSTCLSLNVPSSRISSISLLTGLAAYDAIKHLAGSAIPLTLKWPNDILSDGAKLGGILIESQTNPQSGISDLVIGIGINITIAPKISDRSTTCLNDQGQNITRDDLLNSLQSTFASWLARWDNGLEMDLIRQEWLSRAANIGTNMTVSVGKNILKGTFEGLNENGALQIKGEDGTLKTITGGELL